MRSLAVVHRAMFLSAPPLARPPSRCRRRAPPAQGSMYVPSDSFGGMSPERRAAQSLQTFFTFVAAKVVMSQLEVSWRLLYLPCCPAARCQHRLPLPHSSEAPLGVGCGSRREPVETACAGWVGPRGSHRLLADQTLGHGG